MSQLPTTASLRVQQWFQSFPQEIRELTILSLQLYEREKRLNSSWYDYSFVLFPLAKAFEGYIKYFLYRQQLITAEIYHSTRFRIGRSLNPDVSERQQDDWWLYDDVVRICGKDIANAVWQAWLQGRNHVVHFFPEKNTLHTIEYVEKRMNMILEVMEKTMYCTIRNN